MPYSPSRRNFADRYVPAQLSILAETFSVSIDSIKIAPIDLDMVDGVDYLINGLRISARVRRYEFCQRYSHQFTLRLVEIPKVAAGLVSAMLYGFGDEGGNLPYWRLIDLAPVRAAINDGYPCAIPQTIREGDAEFLAFDYSSFPSWPPVILAPCRVAPPIDADVAECWRRSALRSFATATKAP